MAALALVGLIVAGRVGAAIAAEIDDSHNPSVDQFIHGRAEGPIKMEVLGP